MKTNEGELLRKVIKRSGINITELSRRLNVDRRSVYYWFNQQKISYGVAAKVGRALNYDFSEEFPDYNIKKLLEEKQTAGPQAEQKNKEIINIWMNKYIDLLEKYNQLLIQRGSTYSL
jgi:transcriptional regulator with XRE-family HTH domain